MDSKESVTSQHLLYRDLTYDGFRHLAKSTELSCYEKIGFPNSYRDGYEDLIFSDIRAKLPNLDDTGKVVLDIGPGCSHLPGLLIDHCRRHNHTLLLCDSPEMLNHLPDETFIYKFPGRYPDSVGQALAEFTSRVDVLLSYSVFHYVFAAQPVFGFIDASLGMLAEAGQMLIGDIPNVNKRKRFFKSSAGSRCHQKFTQSNDLPVVEFNCLEPNKIDDAAILGVLARCRSAGFDAYVVPQPPALPMANRREDILVHRA